MNLYIYTKDCYFGIYNQKLFKTSFKYLIKKLFFKKDFTGHKGVADSIYEIYKNSSNIFINKSLVNTENNYALVISGIDILNAVISQKRKFKKLIVGPNMVNNPYENNKLLLKSEIDTLLVPSQIIKTYYENFLIESNIKKEVIIWPAYPTDIKNSNKTIVKKTPNFLIYLKDKKNLSNLSKKIKIILSQKKISYSEVKYGEYKKENFYNYLKKATHLIFLGNSESQCIAQFEAHLHNVHLLILESERYKNRNELAFTFPNYLGVCSPWSKILNATIFYQRFELIDYLYKIDKGKMKFKKSKDFKEEIFDLFKIISK